MITAAQLELPVRRWVPDWLATVCLFAIMLPVTMLNGSYTGSMLEVSNTLGTNTTEDSTHGHHQMANAKKRLIILFAAKDGESLHSQQKQDWSGLWPRS